MTLIQKALATLALVAIMALVAAWGVRQYGNSRVAKQELNSVKEAVREAVADRKEAVKVDIAQTAARVVASREVASTVISHREKSQEVISHYETNADCAGSDAARLGVLISAAREINRVIDSTPSLP